MNLIECKYHNKEFTITKEYAEQLKNKIDLFYEKTSYQGSVNIIFVTVNGVKKNAYYQELMIDDVLIDTLFEK